ncbi:MAG TPA: hypothetical protein VKK31_05210 [Thermoanaerobaculia bacterium]|nr:hypothetical protein [Thermoanaerobaculia bacterium]
MAIPHPKPVPAEPVGRWWAYGIGVLLFLFIPLVLFLFVRHPEPVGLSLAAGLALMIAHRLLARPYMARVLPWKCVWCNRVLPEGPAGSTLELLAGGKTLRARCCPGHRKPASKFFTFLHAWRWPLRLGIFVPLLFLLTALAASAAGQPAPVTLATAWFKLVVGVTVNVAALGYFASGEQAPLSVPFPVHNFFLLGVRNLLWVFRLVGLWWIWQGLAFVLAS